MIPVDARERAVVLAQHRMQQPRLEPERLAERRALRAQPPEIRRMLRIARDRRAALAVRRRQHAATDPAVRAGGAHARRRRAERSCGALCSRVGVEVARRCRSCATKPARMTNSPKRSPARAPSRRRRTADRAPRRSRRARGPRRRAWTGASRRTRRRDRGCSGRALCRPSRSRRDKAARSRSGSRSCG